jgi:hypothetical protein
MSVEQPITTSQIETLEKGRPVSFPIAPPSAARFDLTLMPPSAPPPPSPPPPGSFFLPAPGTPWVLAMQSDFTKMTTLPSGDWDYSGHPGGTSNCLWEPSQVALVPGQGVRLRTQWSAALDSWVCGAIGTPTEFSVPIIVRWYDLVPSALIVGHNKIQLLWAGSWVEIDVDECSVGSVGQWGASWCRTHINSGANVTDPMAFPPQPLGVVWCHEMRLTPVGDGTGTLDIRLNGAKVNETNMPAMAFSEMVANKHWVGTQDEMYSVGSGDKSAIDDRFVLGIEVFQQAA